MSNLAITYPETNRGNSSKVSSLKERIVGEIRPVLLLLFGSVGFVLLIACVNVSNLLLARSTGRLRELQMKPVPAASRRVSSETSAPGAETEGLPLALAMSGIASRAAQCSAMRPAQGNRCKPRTTR